MNWRDVPETLPIRAELWRVVWRDERDPEWMAENCWGRTCPSDNVIELCTSLRRQPSLLQETWLHELMHACLCLEPRERPRYKDERGKRRAVTAPMEEAVVNACAGALALVLNHLGWRQP